MDGKSAGMGFFGWLQIAFIVLKLCGVIDWSWWLVMLPVLAELVLIGSLVGGALLVGWSERRKKAAARSRRASAGGAR